MLRYLLAVVLLLAVLAGWLAVERAARAAARRSRLGPVRAEGSGCGGCGSCRTGCETAPPAGLYSKGAGSRLRAANKMTNAPKTQREDAKTPR